MEMKRECGRERIERKLKRVQDGDGGGQGERGSGALGGGGDENVVYVRESVGLERKRQ